MPQAWPVACGPCAQPAARRTRRTSHGPDSSTAQADPVAGAIRVGPGVRVVLVEGLYLLHAAHGWQLDGLLDECWYLDVDMDTAMQRLLARHQASGSISREQAQVRLDSNDRENAGFVLASRARADWLVQPGAA